MKTNDKFLPIGTVVILKDAKKRIMITGYLSMSMDNSENKIYDYNGCLFPEGIISSNHNLLFNHDQIDKIYHMGLIDDEQIEVNKVLLEEASKITEENISEVKKMLGSEEKEKAETTNTVSSGSITNSIELPM